MDYLTKARPKAMAGEVPVFCAHDEIVDVVKLVTNPQNPNRHSEEQIELLARIIRATGWRQPITVSRRSGYIVKGHGRLAAALKAGMAFVPVDYQEYATEAEEMADLVADNRIAELSEIDNRLLADVFKGINLDEIPAELTGYNAGEFTDILDGLGDLEDEAGGLDSEKYTNKTDIPQYEVTGKTVTLDECVDKEKANEMLYEIEAADGLTDDEIRFLRLAATRFYAFNYSNVAEYYANTASPAMQRVMEKMALVIIDLDDAIANGYVALTKDLEGVIKSDDED